MFRHGIALAITALALAFVACNSGDEGETATPDPSAEASPATEATQDAGGSATPTPDDGGTPTDGGTATAEGTPQGDEATPEGTPSGTPAAAPSPGTGVDISGMSVECALDREESVVDCGDDGTFNIDPPLSVGYTECTLHFILEQPAQLTCTGSEVLQTVYYTIPPPSR